MRLSLPLLLCTLSLSARCSAAYGPKIEIIPGENETVVFAEQVTGLNSWSDIPITVQSNVPINILRYANGNDRFEGNEPISQYSAYVYVKTNCPEVITEESIRSTLEPDSIHVKVKPAPPKRKFMPPSAFEANWNYTSFWCAAEKWQQQKEPRGAEATVEPPTRRLMPLPEGAPNNETLSNETDTVDLTSNATNTTDAAKEVASNTTDVEAAEEEEPNTIPETCHVTLEVLIDGCTADLMVDARKMQMVDVEQQDLRWAKSETDKCTTEYNTLLVGLEPVEYRRESGQEVKYFDKPQCWTVVEGRPFVDSDDKLMFAQAHVAADASWSAADVASGDEMACTNDPITTSSLTDTDNGRHIRPDASAETVTSQEIASTWAHRGLGEHASIASFASFTLDLMTNGAPPELIQDALLAALDEVDHAKTSFEVASLFAQRTIEPGALPKSDLSFDKNITKLALAAAREGCIDETLSALAAAVEANAYLESNNTATTASYDVAVSDAAILREKLTGIALDEGRHSALAWRTVSWACSVDQDACLAVKNEIFTPETLQNAFKRRFGSSSELAREWTKLHEALVPVIISDSRSEATETARRSLGVSCVPPIETRAKTINGKVVPLLVQNIIRDTLCKLPSV